MNPKEGRVDFQEVSREAVGRLGREDLRLVWEGQGEVRGVRVQEGVRVQTRVKLGVN